MSSAKPVLIIPIEVKSRDFFSRIYIAQKAVKLGYRVFVGKSRPLHRQLPFLPRGLILEDEMTFQSRIFFKKATKMGYGIVTIDEEAIAITTGKRYVAQRVYHPNIDHILLHFTRGQEDLDAIANSMPASADLTKLRPAGNPRLDLLREEYFDLYANKSPHEWDANDVILVNSRFSRANPFNMSRAQVRDVVKRKFNFTPEQYEDFCGYLDHTDKLFDAFVPIAQELPKRFPDKIIVFRPHPSENFKFWQDIADQHDNAHCIHSGTAVQWAAHSRVMIHSGCTTAIESALLGLNVVGHCPIESDEYNVDLANNMSLKAETADDIFDAIKRLDAPDSDQRRINALKQRVYLAQFAAGCLEQEASDIMLDHIKQLDWSPPTYGVKQFLQDINWRLRHFYWHAKDEMKMSSAKRLINKKYHAQKHPETTTAEIEDALENFGATHCSVRAYKKGWREIY